MEALQWHRYMDFEMRKFALALGSKKHPWSSKDIPGTRLHGNGGFASPSHL